MNRKTKVLMAVAIAVLLIAVQALLTFAPQLAPRSTINDEADDHTWEENHDNSTAPSQQDKDGHDSNDTSDDGPDQGPDEGQDGKNGTEGKDSDGDGVDDASDELPYDEDNDGCADGEDLYPHEDVAFNLTISTFKLMDLVDVSDTSGEVFFVLFVDGQSVGRLDNGGEAWACQVNVTKSISETFRANVDDDHRYVSIVLLMYDEDGEMERDLLDIDGSSITGRTLNLTFDLLSGTYTGNDLDGIASGSEDSTAFTDDDDAIVHYSLQRSYMPQNVTCSWSYGGRTYSLTAEVTASDYARYRSMEVARNGSGPGMVLLVTPQDRIIKSIASDLERMASAQGLNDTGRLNLALTFVRSLSYVCDNETAGSDDHWRFPVETLYDQVGDGEDTSVLFASIAEAMGYDAVLLVYPSHTAVGVDAGEGDHIDYQGISYYYCDTVSDQRLVGDMPAKYEGQNPSFILQV